MAQIEITKDRDALVDLALNILAKNGALSKQHGVTVPKMFLTTLRQRSRRSARALKRAEALRKKADALSHSVDGDLKEIDSAVHNIGNSIVRQAGTEAAKQWGFRFGEGRSSKKS